MALAPFDLTAARREAKDPEGIPISLAGKEYLLAAQLPIDAFDAFLSEELDLVGVVKAFVDHDEEDKDDGFVDLLLSRPLLPRGLVTAIHAGLATIFGEEQYARFRAGTPGDHASKPQVPDLLRLVEHLAGQYGVGLGKAFRSLLSSDDDGATLKLTSPESVSTPAMSSAKRRTRPSSVSAASPT